MVTLNQLNGFVPNKMEAFLRTPLLISAQIINKQHRASKKDFLFVPLVTLLYNHQLTLIATFSV